MPVTTIEPGPAAPADAVDVLTPLQSVQSHVIRSMDPRAAVYLFFRIVDAAKFRNLISVLAVPGHADAGNDAEVAKFYQSNPEQRRIWSESDAHVIDEQAEPRRTPRAYSWNIAFTLGGLRKLNVNENTLASFPEDFRDGMAARATRLDDVGDSSPENWEGWLGGPHVHGVLWLNSREQTDIVDVLLGASGAFGFEILQKEVGAKIFRDQPDGKRYGIEHFGFRDGISQPFANAGLLPPLAGGGTPRPGGTWDPIALGELLVGHLDEDGITQHRPAHPLLRANGTYMVLRKLEQDVTGFRAYLRRNDETANEKSRLAAQMVGRWPDGTSLVKSSNGPLGEPLESINDFRYLNEDPHGERCPVGSHVRRSNPRDSNNRDEARRRRIWRRSITYGGDFLPYDAPDDGRKRGVLFVALCARIDQQFEFLQSRWLNGGELVGQAGLGRCPITGAHTGDHQDSFSVRNRTSPYSYLPRFVKVRGGDYFFMPSLPALRAIAAGETFDSDPEEDNPGNDETPPTIDADRLFKIGQTFLLPEGSPSGCMLLKDKGLALVGRHRLVLDVLRDDQKFAVSEYDRRIRQITEGESLIVGLPEASEERQRRLRLWGDAGRKYTGVKPVDIARAAMQRLLARHRRAGRVNIVRDVARIVPAILSHHYYGIRGPDWLSPTAVASRFNKLDIAQVPADWLAVLPPVSPQDVPFTSLAAWTGTAFAHVFINVVNAQELAALAERSTAEFRRHLDKTITDAKAPNPPTTNLLGCLLSLDPATYGVTPDRFHVLVRLLLAELITAGAGTLSEALPNFINYVLERPSVLAQARQAALAGNDGELDAIIREVLRFDPVAPIIFRMCTEDTQVDGVRIPKGFLVAVLLKTAMFDQRVFRDPAPSEFSATRAEDIYLHFGAEPHRCKGADIATPVLREMVKAIVMLPQLRRAAGPLGGAKDLLDQWESLVVRFEPMA